MTRFLVPALAALALACGGDIRDNIVGDYNATMTGTLVVGGQSTSLTPDTGTLTISRGSAADAIVFKGKTCNLTGTVTSEDTFNLDPVTCPSRQSGNCLITMSVSAGSGTLDGKALTLTMSGTADAVCDGTPVTGTFTMQWNGTRL